MKQITEDYCSYEIAKLLKEKGFKNEYCDNMLLAEDGDTIWKFATFTNRDDAFDATMKFKKQIPYVTHQMALKWLREVYNLHIEIYRTACGYLYIISNIPYGTDLYNPEYGGDDENSGQWTTYEKCVEAAIKYTLENLI